MINKTCENILLYTRTYRGQKCEDCYFLKDDDCVETLKEEWNNDSRFLYNKFSLLSKNKEFNFNGKVLFFKEAKNNGNKKIFVFVDEGNINVEYDYEEIKIELHSDLINRSSYNFIKKFINDEKTEINIKNLHKNKKKLTIRV